MLAKNIRAMRVAKGLTQVELGDQLGILHNTVSNYETGRVTPSAEMLQRIAEVLDTKMDILMGDIEHIPDDAVAPEYDKYVEHAIEITKRQQDTIDSQQRTIERLVEIVSKKI